MITQMTAGELKYKQDSKEDFLLLDVREQYEYQVARIPNSTLIPLSVLPQRLQELENCKEREIVIHCKLNGRSMQACQFLEPQGFTNLVNLTGGITAWSEQVDPTVPKY